MRTCLRMQPGAAFLLLAVCAESVAGAAASDEAIAPKAPTPPAQAKPPPLPPLKGSQVLADDNMCFQCHTNADQWDEKDPKSWRNYIPEKKLRGDVHWQKGVSCHDCHGGNYDTDKPNVAHAFEDGFRAKPEEVKNYCGYCHKEQERQLKEGVHAHAGPKDERGSGALLACDKCHGTVSHELLPVRDPRSPVFLDHQVLTCGGCHEEKQKALSTYRQSVHGQGLYKLGLLVTAACADCHGAHGIYYKADSKSTLHRTQVADTCGKCHRFIEERLQQSVHGRGHGAGALAARAAPGGKRRETPSCTSCHRGHDLPDPTSAAFRTQLPNRCGNCHTELSRYYAMSMHGELTELGYGPAAQCADCHGSHDEERIILPVADPASTLSAENRRATCMQCHIRANTNFLAFDPHTDYTNAQRDPLLHGIYVVFLTLLISTFCLFGVHSALWLIRGLIDVRKSGRPRGLVPGGSALVRFVPFHRIAHTVLLLSFLGLALTGLPLKYSHHNWAKGLAFCLGGFQSTSIWHRIFALCTFGCLAAYAIRLVQLYWAGRRRGASRWSLVFGPDSPVPNLRDLQDFGRMVGWFVGLSPKPTFERWAYWEKFDFWGACADIVIIGATGLVLWFPNLFCTFLPGSVLNISKVIHSTQALLATGFVFAVHFFATHFRPEKFPADLSVMTGLISREEFQHERPEFLARLHDAGKLDQLRATVPSRARLRLIMVGGLLALAVGLSLLAVVTLAALAD